MKKDEIVANGVVVFFFSLMLFFASRMHGVKRFGDMGSEFWPIMILSGAVILSSALLIGSIRKFLREKKPGGATAAISAEALSARKQGQRKYWLAVICLLGYIIIMPWIGFILSTFLFIYAFILALEERRKLVLAISPILVTALMVLVFGRFLSLPLPRGAEFFAALSRFIY